MSIEKVSTKSVTHMNRHYTEKEIQMSNSYEKLLNYVIRKYRLRQQ